MKRLMLVWVMILCLMPLGAWAENETVEWFTGSGDMYNSLGEHYCFRIEDDHAVLTQYWVEDTDRQPSEILVSAALGGHPLTIIGWGAFDAADLRDTGHWYNDRKVERIILPEGVTTLENGAFLCANDVERIELPASLTEISTEGMTFYNIGAEIVFPNGNPNYQSVNGFLIDTRDQALLYCDEEAAEHPLPSVARIEKNALFNYVFNDASERTELVFPDSVTYIGGFNAYDDPIAKSRIERVIIPSGVTEIDDFAFYWCDATEIVLNEGLRRIGSFAFSAVDLQALGILQFVVGLPDLCLHGLHRLTLCLLVGCILTDKAQTTVHLGEILRTEDKHHLTLDATVTVHITHRLLEALLTLVEFMFEYLQLSLKYMDVTIQTGDIPSDGVNRTTLIGNLVVDHHQVLQTFLHVLLVGLQTTLLFLNLLSYLCLFVLQTVYRDTGFLLRRSCFLCGLLSGGFLGARLFGCFSGSRLLPGRLLPSLLGWSCCHQASQDPEYQ